MRYFNASYYHFYLVCVISTVNGVIPLFMCHSYSWCAIATLNVPFPPFLYYSDYQVYPPPQPLILSFSPLLHTSTLIVDSPTLGVSPRFALPSSPLCWMHKRERNLQETTWKACWRSSDHGRLSRVPSTETTSGTSMSISTLTRCVLCELHPLLMSSALPVLSSMLLLLLVLPVLLVLFSLLFNLVTAVVDFVVRHLTHLSANGGLFSVPGIVLPRREKSPSSPFKKVYKGGGDPRDMPCKYAYFDISPKLPHHLSHRLPHHLSRNLSHNWACTQPKLLCVNGMAVNTYHSITALPIVCYVAMHTGCFPVIQSCTTKAARIDALVKKKHAYTYR